jgi:hypothetical protein
VRAEIKDQLVEEIRNTGDLLVFNRAELEVTTGKAETFFVGVKAGTNDNNPGTGEQCYTMGIKCIQPLKGTQCTVEGGSSTDAGVVVGGRIPGSQQPSTTPAPGAPIASNDEWFQLFSDVRINENEVGVYPVTVQISGAAPDTYSMEFTVYEGCTGNDAAGNTIVPTEYQSKQFFVVLR